MKKLSDVQDNLQQQVVETVKRTGLNINESNVVTGDFKLMLERNGDLAVIKLIANDKVVSETSMDIREAATLYTDLFDTIEGKLKGK